MKGENGDMTRGKGMLHLKGSVVATLLHEGGK